MVSVFSRNLVKTPGSTAGTYWQTRYAVDERGSWCQRRVCEEIDMEEEEGE